MNFDRSLFAGGTCDTEPDRYKLVLLYIKADAFSGCRWLAECPESGGAPQPDELVPHRGKLREVLGHIHKVFNESAASPVKPFADVKEALRTLYDPYNRELRALLVEPGYRSFPDWLGAS